MGLRTLKYGRMVFCILFILVLAAGCMKQERISEAAAEIMEKTGQAQTEEIQTKEIQTDEVQTEAASEVPETKAPDRVLQALSKMSLEEKLLQMFIVTPEAVTDGLGVVEADETFIQAVGQYPVGGFIYFNKNIVAQEQLEKLLADILSAYREKDYIPPFQCVDEEGGTVARLANNEALQLENVGNMSEIKDEGAAYEAGRYIGAYLSDYGFSLDFAPVVDVFGKEGNMMEKRAFGSDAKEVSQKAGAFLEGLQSTGVYAVLKHFPGLGSSAGDTHKGYDVIDKNTEQLMQWDLIPFKDGIAAGAEVVMVSHVSVPQVTGKDMPCSLSEEVVTGLLRDMLGFDGIVVTDAMNMQAVTDYHSPAEAACLAVKAGVDIILMPQDFMAAYEGLLAAVQCGDISEDRINESVYRILRLKLK